MALPTQAQQALIWQAYGADATNLVAPIACDFTTYSAYTFNPQGLFRQAGNVFATGLVVDNLLSSSPVTVLIGPISETVPPYTKTTLTLGGTSAQVVVSGQQSRIIVTFFRGTYMGTTAGTNFYQAQLAAGLAVETGFINMFAGSTAGIPVGYLLCDGSAVSRDTYKGLFAVIGTLYGSGDGSTTFNLPDLTSRVPIGAGTGSGLTTRALGSKGGAEAVTITAQQIPAHTHNVNDPGHAHAITDPGHTHGITQTAHAHGVNDPGHTHPFNFYRQDSGAFASTTDHFLWDGGGAPNTWTNNTGEWGNSGRPNFWDAAEAYRMFLGTIGTSITIQGGLANITNQSAGTQITINGGTTGITLSSFGGLSGVTQPTPTVPPYTGVNFVIKT